MSPIWLLCNNIRLQPLKCLFLAINSTETDSMSLTNSAIKHVNEAIYLGYVFSSTGNVNTDVISEITTLHCK